MILPHSSPAAARWRLRRARALATLVLLAAALPTAHAAAPDARIACTPAGAAYAYDCAIDLADPHTRAPVDGARFTVTADMPSMPMAHNITPVDAMPDGQSGRYRARLALEMDGVWLVKLTFSAPVRDRVLKRVRFEGSAG
ncbi:FixH family protein [Burkholderia stagnalis]|uniref:FixH family protein n=1 Tax=Burkholderia stagnalis TaxID=1503054 RepID=UPI000F7FCCE4|nr:FixH family protein [Burkholderia stagnalis]